MKKKITPLAALLALTACEHKEIDPIVSMNKLEYQSCSQESATTNARMQSPMSAQFSTITSGAWNDPNTWEGGIVPVSGSSGSVVVNHYVWLMPPSGTPAFVFNGDITVSPEAMLELYPEMPSFQVNGHLTNNGYILFNVPLMIHQGAMTTGAGSYLASTKPLIFDQSQAVFHGKAELLNDVRVTNNSTFTVSAIGDFRTSDDLHVGSPSNPSDESKVINQTPSSCEARKFLVQDAIFLHSPQVRIQSSGEGRVHVGGGTQNHDDSQSSFTPLYSRVFGAAGTNYSTQITADVRNPTMGMREDPAFPLAPYCGGPLPVRLISWKGEFLPASNQIKLTWKTTNESNSGHFTVYQSKPCEPLKNAKPIIREKAVGNSDKEVTYTKTFPVTAGGIYHFRLEQTDSDNSVQTFQWISVEAGQRLQ
jgi:hypothetical protein